MKATFAAAAFAVGISSAVTAGVLDEIGQTSVDALTFGIRALEQELRTANLEVCAVSNCRDDEKRFVVTFGPVKPKGMSETVPWPVGGAIMIRLNRTFSGPQNASWISEAGCKTALGHFQFGGLDQPWMNYARFFVPERDLRGLRSVDDGSPVGERMMALNRSMVVIATLVHGEDTSRPSMISCAAPLLSVDEAVAYNQRTFGK